MVNSYNGWEGIPNTSDPRLTVIEPVPGRKFRLRKGDVATVFDWLIKRYDAEVEDIQAGQLDDWSYAYRAVRESTSLSNHASGTAVDLNSLKHPWQTTAESNMTAAQIRACERLVADAGGVLRWLRGHDPMHWEIQRMDRGGSPAQVAALAAKIRSGQETLPIADPLVAVVVPKRAPRPIDWQSPPTDLIKIVQEIVGMRADGIRGPKTMEATRALQKRLGVAVDGRFGPGTAEAWLLSRPNLKETSRGVDVKLVQWIGGENTDGIWGRRTDDAVESMQAWAGLTVDGIAGPTTKRAITI